MGVNHRLFKDFQSRVVYFSQDFDGGLMAFDVDCIRLYGEAFEVLMGFAEPL